MTDAAVTDAAVTDAAVTDAAVNDGPTVERDVAEEPTVEGSTPTEPGTWLYVFGPGERPELRTDPTSWTEHDNAVGAAHYERLRRATIDGVVLFAGLSLEPDGPAVVVFDAPTRTEAEAFVAADPFVSEGLFTATLYPFHASLMRAGDGPAPT